MSKVLDVKADQQGLAASRLLPLNTKHMLECFGQLFPGHPYKNHCCPAAMNQIDGGEI